LEIYRLHAKENHTITSLAGQFDLDEYTVWGICTRLRTKAALLIVDSHICQLYNQIKNIKNNCIALTVKFLEYFVGIICLRSSMARMSAAIILRMSVSTADEHVPSKQPATLRLAKAQVDCWHDRLWKGLFLRRRDEKEM